MFKIKSIKFISLPNDCKHIHFLSMIQMLASITPSKENFLLPNIIRWWWNSLKRVREEYTKIFFKSHKKFSSLRRKLQKMPNRCAKKKHLRKFIVIENWIDKIYIFFTLKSLESRRELSSSIMLNYRSYKIYESAPLLGCLWGSIWNLWHILQATHFSINSRIAQRYGNNVRRRKTCF